MKADKDMMKAELDQVTKILRDDSKWEPYLQVKHFHVQWP